MAKFAHLSGNVVNNLIEAETLQDAESVLGAGSCIEYTDHWTVGIGWIYDGTKFTDPSDPTE